MRAVGINPNEVGGGKVVVFGPPEGMAHCDPLATVLQRYDDGTMALLSRWEPSADERAKIAAGGDIVLYLYGGVQVPVALGVITIEDP